MAHEASEQVLTQAIRGLVDLVHGLQTRSSRGQVLGRTRQLGHDRTDDG